MSAATRQPRRPCTGHTLLEALLVLVVIAILAGVALPSLNAGNADHLVHAGSQVAGALRYARSQSQSTGTLHGVRFELQPTARLRVFRQKDTPIFDVLHPVTRLPYDIPLEANRGAASFKLQLAKFSFAGEPPGDDTLVFDSHGAPVKVTGSGNLPLADGRIALSNGAAAVTVLLAPHTGRVTLQ